MSYSESLSTANPGCFVFLVDQSGSMSDPWGNTGRRDEQVSDIINRFLQDICLTCDVGGKVKDRAIVSVIGYGQKVHSAFEGPLSGREKVKLSEIDANPVEIQTKTVKQPDGAGGIVDTEMQFPVWIKPLSEGGTPMRQAFERALVLVKEHADEYPNCFPPIVVNITDGAYDSGFSPKQIVEQIRSTGTSNGNSLVFNIHIEDNNNVVFCPSSDEGLNGLAKELYEFSSELPASLVSIAKEKGEKNIKSGSRGFVFNGDFVALVKFLKFASPIQAR